MVRLLFGKRECPESSTNNFYILESNCSITMSSNTEERRERVGGRPEIGVYCKNGQRKFGLYTLSLYSFCVGDGSSLSDGGSDNKIKAQLNYFHRFLCNKNSKS